MILAVSAYALATRAAFYPNPDGFFFFWAVGIIGRRPFQGGAARGFFGSLA